MAEAFLKDKLINTTSEIEVFSAGTNVKSNSGATKEAIKVMENFDIDLSNHTTHLLDKDCLLYTSPSPRDGLLSRMPSSA